MTLEEKFAQLIVDRETQKLEDFIEDLQYEADIDESYEKLYLPYFSLTS